MSGPVISALVVEVLANKEFIKKIDDAAKQADDTIAANQNPPSGFYYGYNPELDNDC